MHQVVSCEEHVGTHTPALLHFGDFWWVYVYLVMRNRLSFPTWLLNEQPPTQEPPDGGLDLFRDLQVVKCLV